MDVTSYLLGKKAGGGSGGVSSVNGKTGNVVLATSDLQNDSNYQTLSNVQDLLSNIDNFFEIGNYPNKNNSLNFSTLKKGIYISKADSSAYTFYYKKNESSEAKALDGGSIRTLFMVVYNTIDNVGTPVANTNIANMYGITDNKTYLYEYTFYIDTNGELNSMRSSSIIANFFSSADQRVAGVKTFDSIPKQGNSTAPTLNTQFTNKKYVDDSIANAITTTLNSSF